MHDSRDGRTAAAAPAETRQLITFALGSEEYGIDIACVQEINRMVEITRVPRTAAHLEGIINLRGQLIPVMDLRTRLRIARAEPTRNTRIIVAEVAGARIGLIVDGVFEVARIAADSVEPAPEMLAGTHAHTIAGVAQLETRLIIVLDLEAVVAEQAE